MKRLSVFLLFSLILAVGFAAYAGKPPPPIPDLTGSWIDPAASCIYLDTTDQFAQNTVYVNLYVFQQVGTQFVGTLTITGTYGETQITNRIAGDFSTATKEVNFQAGYNDPYPSTKFAIINGKGTLGTDLISGNLRRLVFDMGSNPAVVQDISFNLKKLPPLPSP